MSTLTEPRHAVKTTRTVNLILAPNDCGENGIVRIIITRGRTVEATDYLLFRVHNGFKLVKLLGEHTTYRVNDLIEPDPRDCHAAALAKLVQLGRL